MSVRTAITMGALALLWGGPQSGLARDAVDSAPAPATLPGAEPFVFRTVAAVELRMHVFKPAGWRAADRRPCLVCFFGGGWVNGSPDKMRSWAEWAAANGLVGIAPDYRTRGRFGTPPEECVADGRAALHWIDEHAVDLGIDPARVVVLGSSAGGHVAAWTAIPDPISPHRAAEPIARTRPAALVLLWPVTDTTATGYGGPKRFDGDPARAAALSVTGRMPPRMPPTLVVHGTQDATVPFANSEAFTAKMREGGNECRLIPIEGGKHALTANKLGAGGRAARTMIEGEVRMFLAMHGLLPPP